MNLLGSKLISGILKSLNLDFQFAVIHRLGYLLINEVTCLWFIASSVLPSIACLELAGGEDRGEVLEGVDAFDSGEFRSVLLGLLARSQL